MRTSYPRRSHQNGNKYTKVHLEKKNSKSLLESYVNVKCIVMLLFVLVPNNMNPYTVLSVTSMAVSVVSFVD